MRVHMLLDKIWARVDFTAREKFGHKTLGLGRNLLQWPSLVTKISRKTSSMAGLGGSKNDSPFVFLLNVPNVLGRSVLVCKCAAAGYAIWKR